MSFHHDLRSKGHLSYLLSQLQGQRPTLLWIRLAGPCTGSGNKRDAARSMHLSELFSSQRAIGGAAVLEANLRSQVWNMQVFKSLVADLCVTQLGAVMRRL